MRRLFVSILILLSFSVSAQIDDVRKITETLCSPEFHGRGYVNKGDSIAAAFLAQQFEQIGISSIKGNYFQAFGLDVNTFPGEMSFELNDRRLTPGMHYMVDPASKGFNGEFYGLEIDAAVASNESTLFEAMNKVLVDKKYSGLILNFTEASEDTIKALRGIGYELAQLMPIVEVLDSKFTWSVSQNQLNNAYVYIQDSIYHANGKFSIALDAKWIKNYQSQNVVAYLPAKKKCAKTVVFSAHYDHLGRMGKETYFPGANDNASGTTMLLTMAEYFKTHPSDYNILFIAFAGEEAGLVGSKYFVEHPLIKLKKIKFLINLDIMGSGEEGVTVVNATLFEDEFKALCELNEEEQYLYQIKSRGPAANSDHYWFTQKGVPAFFIYTMGPNKHYHDVFDKYEDLSFAAYDQITQLLIRFVERL